MAKKKCEAETELCSGELVVTYYNSAGSPLNICGPCSVYVGRMVKLSKTKPKKGK